MFEYEEQLFIHHNIRKIVKSEIHNLRLKEFIYQMWPDICTVILENMPNLNNIHNLAENKIHSERLKTLINEPKISSNVFTSILKKYFSKDNNYKPFWEIKDHNAISFMTDNRILLYAYDQDLDFISTRKNEWFQKYSNIKLNEQIKKNIFNFANSVLERLFNLVNLQFNKKFFQIIGYQLLILFSWYSYHRNNINKIVVPKIFLSGTMGSPFNRLLSDKIIQKNGLVHVFDHGVGSGLWSVKDDLEQDLERANVYITYGKKMIEGVKMNDDPSIRINTNNKPKILHFAFQKNKINSKKLKSLKINSDFVIVSACASQNRIMPTVLYNDKILRELQINLIKKIQKNKLTVSVKPHPENADRGLLKTMKKMKINIISDYFDEVNWKNEVLIFENPQTSAFRDAIINDLPIIILNLPRLIILKNTFYYLSKRCVIIDCEFRNNRIIFDENEIFTSISNAKELAKDKTFKNLYYGIDE